MVSYRYHQAYYTWETASPSCPVTGWEIHKASLEDDKFSRECKKLASGLDQGQGGTTSEYLVYSADWNCFVSVGVSPRPEGDEVGRKNILCHLFVPQSHWVPPDPADYLLDFQFDSVPRPGDRLSAVTINKGNFNYRDILDRFALGSDGVGIHKKRLEVLLRLLYQRILSDAPPLLFYMRHDGLDGMEYAKAAKSLVYLLHLWVPSATEEQMRRYRRSLTFSINAEGRTGGIGILFNSGDNGGYSLEHLEMYGEENDFEGGFFCTLAEKAQDSADSLQQYLKQLSEVFDGKAGSLDEILLAYKRKRMDEGNPIPEEELYEKLGSLIRKSERIPWYKSFCIDFLKQLDLEQSVHLDGYWDEMIDWLDREREPEIETVTARILECVGRKNPDRLKKYCCQIPQRSGPFILDELYRRLEKKIREERDANVPDKIGNLAVIADRYSPLWSIGDFKWSMLNHGVELYKSENLDAGGREKITGLMVRYDEENWDKEIHDYYICQGNDYIQWLFGQAGRVDSRYVRYCYGQMLAFLRESADVDMELLSELERSLAERADGQITDGQREEYRSLVWEIQEPLITRQINNLSSDDLDGLMGFKNSVLRGNCLEAWENKACRILEKRIPVELETLKQIERRYNGLTNNGKEQTMKTLACRLERAAESDVELYAWHCFLSQTGAGRFWSIFKLKEAFPCIYTKIKDAHCRNYILGDDTYMDKLFHIYEQFCDSRSIDEAYVRNIVLGTSDKSQENSGLIALMEIHLMHSGKTSIQDCINYMAVRMTCAEANGKSAWDIYDAISKNTMVYHILVDTLKRADGCTEDEKKRINSILTMFHQVETFQTQDSWTLDTLREAIRIYKESGAGGGADSGGFGKKIEKQLEYQKKRIYDECSQYNELCNDFYGTNKSRVMSETEKGRITARTQTCGQAQSYGRNQSYGQNQSYGPPQSYGQNQGFAQGQSWGQDTGTAQNRSYEQRQKTGQKQCCAQDTESVRRSCAQDTESARRSCAQDTESARRSYAQEPAAARTQPDIPGLPRFSSDAELNGTRIVPVGKTPPGKEADYKEPDYKKPQYDWPPPSGTNIQGGK